MNELSLHILDIVQNSIKADASLVEIHITESTSKDLYTIEIKDNGCGMDEHTLTTVSDPFFTTRTTRKVGMGTSLFKMAAEMCNGSFTIDSTLSVGTTVTATFQRSHIDRAPLGAIEDTIIIIMLNDANIDVVYRHRYDEYEFVFDTRQVKEVLEDIPLTDYSVLEWAKETIRNGIKNIKEEEPK
jgi:nitrogen fixation/metabolism regulation signal transduction histidine kinase